MQLIGDFPPFPPLIDYHSLTSFDPNYIAPILLRSDGIDADGWKASVALDIETDY